MTWIQQNITTYNCDLNLSIEMFNVINNKLKGWKAYTGLSQESQITKIVFRGNAKVKVRWVHHELDNSFTIHCHVNIAFDT